MQFEPCITLRMISNRSSISIYTLRIPFLSLTLSAFFSYSCDAMEIDDDWCTMSSKRIIQHSLIFIELDRRSLEFRLVLSRSYVDLKCCDFASISLPPLHLGPMWIWIFRLWNSIESIVLCVRVSRQNLICIDRFDDDFRQFCFIRTSQQNIHSSVRMRTEIWWDIKWVRLFASLTFLDLFLLYCEQSLL